MQFSKSHTIGVRDKVYCHVENGATTAIGKGSLMVWDVTDNANVAGIMENTWGLRVTICPANPTLFNMAGFADQDMAGTIAAERGISYLMQVYGARDDLLVDTAAADNDTVVGGLLIPSTDTAGKVQGLGTNTAPAGKEIGQIVGIAFKVVAVGATDTITGVVTCMNR